jgi:hypothetical protein
VARSRTPRRLLAPLGAASIVFALSACVPEPPAPEPTTSSVSPNPSPTSTGDAGPALLPEGTAEENLPFFTEIVQDVWAGPDPLAGRSYIDALVAAGFDRGAMQVTADQSTVGNPAESIQFSVRWGDECLIGQVGPATGDPVAVVEPGLTDGGCLVGRTRPIDW